MSATSRAKGLEFEETMQFLELAFKEHNMPEPRFDKILPDLYLPTDEAMENVFLLRDSASGRIVSSAGLFPIKLKLWGEPVSAQGIGGVGTLPEFRGQGMMSVVMSEINAELQRRGGPFSWLSGIRYRYGTWGYEKAGYIQINTLAKRNLKAHDSPGFAVSELKYENLPWEGIIALRSASPATGGNAPLSELKVKYFRPSLLFFMACKGDEKTFAVFGYDNICEWFGDANGLPDIAAKLLQEREEIQLRLPLDGSDVFSKISHLVEDHAIIMQGNFAVVDLEECLKLVCLNPAVQELPSKGRRSFSLQMEAEANPGQCAHLLLENGRLSCGKGLLGEPLKLTPRLCAALLFGPLKPSLLFGAETPTWLDQILPLPVYVPRLYWV